LNEGRSFVGFQIEQKEKVHMYKKILASHRDARRGKKKWGNKALGQVPGRSYSGKKGEAKKVGAFYLQERGPYLKTTLPQGKHARRIMYSEKETPGNGGEGEQSLSRRTKTSKRNKALLTVKLW